MTSGYERLPALWLDQITVYGDHHIFWVVQGRAHVWADSRQYEIRGLEALWLPAGTTVGSIATEAGSVALSVLIPEHRLPTGAPGIAVHQLDQAAGDALVAAYVRWLMPFWTEQDTTEALSTLSRSSNTPATIGYPAMPDRSPAAQIATALLRDPSDSRTAREWAAYAGTSERNLTRCFIAETGKSFSAWRTSLRVAQAVRLLREGLLPRDVATAVGYGSTSALDHAFQRIAGITPSQALATMREEQSIDPPQSPMSSLDRIYRRRRLRTGCDEFEIGAHTRIPAATTFPRVNDFHVFVWMLRGSAIVEIGAEAVSLEEGQAVWLPAGAYNCIRTEEGGIVVPIGDLPARADLRRIGIAPIRIAPSRGPEMLYRSAASYTYLRPYQHDTEHMMDLAQLPCSVRSGPPDSVAQILAAPLSDARTIRDWASDLNIPADLLARRFRRRTGRSYRDWRVNRRMTFARERLARSSTTIGEVSRELGYSELSAFTRVFTRHHGKTPTEFQKAFQHVRHFLTDENAIGKEPTSTHPE